MSVILSKKFIYMCPTPNVFREKAAVFHCTVRELLIRKRYNVLLLMLVFIVQVTKLV
jgi:hypothetical protein